MKFRNTPMNIRKVSLLITVIIIVVCFVLRHIDYYIFDNDILYVIAIIVCILDSFIDFFWVRCNYCGKHLKISFFDSFCPYCSMPVDATKEEAHKHKVDIENAKGKELTEKYFNE